MATLQAIVQHQKQHELVQQQQLAAHQNQRQIQAAQKPPPPQLQLHAATADQRFQSPPRFLEHAQEPPTSDALRATPVPSKHEHDAPSLDAKQPHLTPDVSKANGAEPADRDAGIVRFVPCDERTASSAAFGYE